MKRIGKFSTLAFGLVLAASVFGTGRPAVAQANDTQIQTDLTKKLGSSKFKNIQINVASGEVTLTGSVPLYDDKEQADNKAHHIKNVTGVRNEIEVTPKEPVSDNVIRQKVGEKIAYDRVGYFDNTFNAITIDVQSGVVTLGGHAENPVAKASALSIAGTYSGVTDVVDDISVDPVSMMDDRIRVAVARTVYGQSALNRYAIDPARPIRISVQNGNVTLSGVVDSEMDKNIANIQANQVSGVFHVTNNLQVANSDKKDKK